MNVRTATRLLATLLMVGPISESQAEPDTEAIVIAALAQEFLLMSRPMNEFERDFMNAKKRSDTLATGVLGGAYMKDEGRVPVEFVRAPDSLTILNNAAHHCEQEREDKLREIVNKRAVFRGDQIMALANDQSVGLFVRESLMRHSIEYYRIGEAQQKQIFAESQRKMLEPEVKRAEAERKALLEKFQDEMQPIIEEVRRGSLDMLKSDAEKREFAEEADALEDELDF